MSLLSAGCVWINGKQEVVLGRRSASGKFALNDCGDSSPGDWQFGTKRIISCLPTIRDLSLGGPPRTRKLLLTTQDEQRCDSLIKLLAQNETWLVPTLAWQRGGTFLDQRDLKKYVPGYWRDVTWRRFTDEMMPDLLRDPLALRQEYFAHNLQMVGALHRAGVPFMAGTDTAPGVYIMPGFSLHDELANFVEAGFTPMESLQTATSNPARFLGMEANFGSVAPGKIADLVLLSANPLDDIRNTQKINVVIAHGPAL
jgi:hypothetical protein